MDRFEIVKGHSGGYYDQKVVPDYIIKYFQLTTYPNSKQMYNVRMFVVKPSASIGGVVLNNDAQMITNYELSYNDLQTFMEYLKSAKNTDTVKYGYGMYPCVSFDDLPAPSINDILASSSELLKKR